MRYSVRWLLALVLFSAALAPQRQVAAAPAAANGVVGDGTPASCTEAELTTEMSSPGYITFACGAAPFALVLTVSGGHALTFGQRLTLDGGGLITLSGANVDDHRLFSVGIGAALTLTHLSLVNATMLTGPGGALANQGVLTLDDVVISHARAQSVYGGGAIYNQGSLTIRNSTLRQNSSAGGGAIYNQVGAQARIVNTTFVSNTVLGGAYGGAISNSGWLTVTDSSFAGNALTLNVACASTYCGGGAIGNLAGGSVVVTATTFTSNTTNNSGGGILNMGSLRLALLTVNDNLAAYGGGVANVLTGTVELDRVIVRANQAAVGAGLLNNLNGHLLIYDSMVLNNVAEDRAGGLVNGDSHAVLQRVTFAGNRANNAGGGIENTDNGTLSIENSTFTGNQAGAAGGAIWNHIGLASLTYVTVSENTSAAVGSGGLDNSNDTSSSLSLQNTVLADNQPANCAGKPAWQVTYSLSTDNTCMGSGNGNLPNTAQLLGPLANNGGPTLTRLPAPGSAAVDNGQCLGGYTLDQRGLPQLVGAGCDIGAVERQVDDYGWYVFLPAALR